MGANCGQELCQRSFDVSDFSIKKYGFNPDHKPKGLVKIMTFLIILERKTIKNKTILFLNDYDCYQYAIKSPLPIEFMKNDQVHILYTEHIDMDGHPYRCIHQIYNTETDTLYIS